MDPTRLVPLETNYRDYFSCSNTNTFCGCYTAVLAPYFIDPAVPDAPANILRLIYTAAQEVVPTPFFSGIRGRGGGVHI